MIESDERFDTVRQRLLAKCKADGIDVPDFRDPAVQARIEDQFRSLDPKDEEEAIRWCEAVAYWNDE